MLIYVNKGKELLVGLGVGDNNNCMQVEVSSAHHCGCMAYGSIAMAACWVFIIMVIEFSIHFSTFFLICHFLLSVQPSGYDFCVKYRHTFSSWTKSHF